MEEYKKESKRIKTELNKIADRSNQICRILDKDDVDINFINKIGKKTYTKTANDKYRKTNILPNLIYYQGKKKIKKNNNINNIKGIKKKKNILKLNDFHSNFFNILKGKDIDKVLKSLLISENISGKKMRKNKSKEEKQNEKKLELIAPGLIKKKKEIMERLPLNYKKYRKNYEYKNNQLILDEVNEKRYKKYDEPFIYSLNRYPSKDVLPKYNNLFFKYQKNKIRDYYYRKTYEKFRSSEKDNNKNEPHIQKFEII